MQHKKHQRQPKREKPRKRPNNPVAQKVEDNGSQGFNTLKDKLQEWIAQSEREDLIKK